MPSITNASVVVSGSVWSRSAPCSGCLAWRSSATWRSSLSVINGSWASVPASRWASTASSLQRSSASEASVSASTGISRCTKAATQAAVSAPGWVIKGSGKGSGSGSGKGSGSGSGSGSDRANAVAWVCCVCRACCGCAGVIHRLLRRSFRLIGRPARWLEAVPGGRPAEAGNPAARSRRLRANGCGSGYSRVMPGRWPTSSPSR